MLWTTLPRRRPLLGCWTIKLSCEAFWEALSAKRILHSLLWEKHAKELGILIFKLINESEREFLTTAMKIYLTKKKRKRHWIRFLKIRKFLGISHSWRTQCLLKYVSLRKQMKSFTGISAPLYISVKMKPTRYS